eukprot:COSAG01_NODE_1931_length_8874_cov_108.307236_4_plen_144_part_00
MRCVDGRSHFSVGVGHEAGASPKEVLHHLRFNKNTPRSLKLKTQPPRSTPAPAQLCICVGVCRTTTLAPGTRHGSGIARRSLLHHIGCTIVAGQWRARRIIQASWILTMTNSCVPPMEIWYLRRSRYFMIRTEAATEMPLRFA